MDEQAFKKVLNETLTPIREDIKDVKESVNTLKGDINTLKGDINTLKGSVLTIEQTMTSYADSYKINQHNIERVDTRLTTVEENLNIDVPEDLKVPHFATK